MNLAISSLILTKIGRCLETPYISSTSKTPRLGWLHAFGKGVSFERFYIYQALWKGHVEAPANNCIPFINSFDTFLSLFFVVEDYFFNRWIWSYQSYRYTIEQRWLYNICNFTCMYVSDWVAFVYTMCISKIKSHIYTIDTICIISPQENNSNNCMKSQQMFGGKMLESCLR